MNPEIVDIMLQLRELNTYFSESNTPIETIPEEDEENVQPPALMISNSQFTIPLSLDSTTTLETSVHSTSLASRRQRSLPPLALGHSKLKDIVYPDIPTAFMGNSSVYSPIDPTANIELSPMNLQDMIGTLRSRCASLQVQTPATADLFAYQQAMISGTQTSGHAAGDEWAFANELSKSFVSDSPGHLSADGPPGSSFAVSNLLDDSLLDETLVSTPILSEVFIEPKKPLSASPKVPLDPSYLPPSSPLPPCPAQSSPKSPRGILKRCKSVRFASDDKETDTKADIAQPVPVQGPRRSTGSAIPSGKRLPPVRHTYAPKCIVIPPQNMSPNKHPPAFLSAAGRRKPGEGGPIYAALASPPRAMPPSSERRHTTIAARSRSPTTTKTSAAEQRPTIPVPKMTRHSMTPASPQKTRPPMMGGRLSLERSAVGVPVGKENATKSSVRSTLMKSRFTMDENALRRGQDKDAPKSRVPMPLRNILTRFK